MEQAGLMVWSPDPDIYPYISLFLEIYHGRAPGVFFHNNLELTKTSREKNEAHSKIASKLNLGANVRGITRG